MLFCRRDASFHPCMGMGYDEMLGSCAVVHVICLYNCLWSNEGSGFAAHSYGVIIIAFFWVLDLYLWLEMSLENGSGTGKIV